MHLTNRWDVVFYFFGAISILYWVVIFHLCYDRPEKNPFISEAEKRYLERQINDFNKENSELPPTPWKLMLFCPPVIALSFSIVCFITFFFGWLSKYNNNEAKMLSFVSGSLQLVLLHCEHWFTQIPQWRFTRIHSKEQYLFIRTPYIKHNHFVSIRFHRRFNEHQM